MPFSAYYLTFAFSEMRKSCIFERTGAGNLGRASKIGEGRTMVVVNRMPLMPRSLVYQRVSGHDKAGAAFSDEPPLCQSMSLVMVPKAGLELAFIHKTR